MPSGLNRASAIRRAGVLLLVLLAGSRADAADAAPRGVWPFRMDVDVDARSPIDLRRLNEASAGEHGFVRQSADGNDFVLGDGRPVRFWGVAAHVAPAVSDEDLARHARFLARMGVNMVRVGGATPGLIPQKPGSKLDEPNPDFVNDIWRLVAAMKRQGIYTRIAPLWDHGSIRHLDPDWGIEGYKSGQSINALLFFEPRLQQAYKAWMKKLLTEKNPHTGIALRDDPALAIIQIVSEDTMLFFWFDAIHGGPRRELETRFAKHAAKKYGSVDKAIAAWEKTQLADDAPGEGRLALYPIGSLVGSQINGHPQRARDQIAFLAQLEHDFFAEMKRYLKEDLGVKQLVTASNFAGAKSLLDQQLWAWTAGDLVEFNNFFTTTTQGGKAMWLVEPGQFFVPRSATRDPQLPALREQVAGRPFVLSSTAWVAPNLYTAEGPLLNACYAAISGIDGMLWFSAQAPAYDMRPIVTYPNPAGALKRWSLSNPGFLAQFPAAALIFRQGLIEPAKTVVRLERSPNAILERLPPFKADIEAPNKARLCGRVEVAFADQPKPDTLTDLSNLIDEPSGEIRTTHGQLTMNPRRGLCTINSPKAQGVVGFLKEAGGTFALRDATLTSDNEYASIVLVPLDDRPLSQSGKILLQVGTVVLPTDWATREVEREVKGLGQVKGLEILSIGKLPWLVQDAKATVSLANPRITVARQLDESGRPVAEVALRRTKLGVEFTVPGNALYVELEAGQ